MDQYVALARDKLPNTLRRTHLISAKVARTVAHRRVVFSLHASSLLLVGP